MRISAEHALPNHMKGIITEIYINYLNNTSEAEANKVFSMTILKRMDEKYSQLKGKLIESHKFGLEFGRAGYKIRSGKILARLSGMSKICFSVKIY